MKKLLIIEDEKELGAIYAKFLRSSGFQVECTETAEAAVDLAHKFAADLILLDHGLAGGKDGIESIPNLKKNFPKAKIVLFSNYSAYEMEDKAIKAGADAYWVKLDIRLKELAERVGKFIG